MGKDVPWISNHILRHDVVTPNSRLGEASYRLLLYCLQLHPANTHW